MSKADSRELWLQVSTVDAAERPAGRGVMAVAMRRKPVDSDAPNEDGACMVSWANSVVLALADGLGGHAGGDVASAKMLETLTDELVNTDGDAANVQAAVLEAIESTNRALVERPGSAATTVLVAAIDGDQLRCYHAGDSDLLVVGQRGKLKFQTVSHSPVGYAVEAGVLDADDGLHHEDRHFVSNVVGMQGMRVELGTAIPLAPRDTVVLASDGVWDNLHVHEVVELVRKGNLEHAARALVDAASLRMKGTDPKVAGKPDDVTVLLYRAMS